MDITRRSVTFSGLVLAAATALRGTPALAGDLRTLRVAFATKVESGTGLNTLLAGPLGYAAKAGFQIDSMHLGSMTNVQVALDRGAADVGTAAPSFYLPLFAKHALPPIVAFYEYTYPYKWDIVVKENSPIHSYADLVGKKVGVANLGTTDYPVTRTVLKANGIDPDSMTWQAVGEGVTAGVALDRGAIDALAYYDVGFGIIENAGIALRYLPRPKIVPMIGGLYTATKRDFLEKNRDLCVAYGRCMAMATEFILANPKAAVAIYLKRFPEAAPRGVSPQEAIEKTFNTIRRRITLYRPPHPGGKIGQIYESEWRDEAKFLGLDIPDVTPLFTTALTDEINDFDRAPIIAAAKAYKI